jgi:Protein of unknown function (DUF4058)
MPMHDWTLVTAGTYHDFHGRWLGEMTNRLNGGLLPDDHYAQTEQVMTGMTADILTLRTGESLLETEQVEEGVGGLAIALAPPRVRFTESLETDLYVAKARHIAIRHSSDDRMVALVELVSPGNKAGEAAFRTFVDKASTALRQGLHLLIIDPVPPGPRDPKGIHGTIWSDLGGKYDPPADKPLTLAAYAVGWRQTAYVEPIAVGDPLTAMPLFFRSDRYVLVPLEETYGVTFRGTPRRYRELLEPGT